MFARTTSGALITVRGENPCFSGGARIEPLVGAAKAIRTQDAKVVKEARRDRANIIEKRVLYRTKGESKTNGGLRLGSFHTVACGIPRLYTYYIIDSRRDRASTVLTCESMIFHSYNPSSRVAVAACKPDPKSCTRPYYLRYAVS